MLVLCGDLIYIRAVSRKKFEYYPTQLHLQLSTMKFSILSLLAGSLFVSPAFAACSGDTEIPLTESDDNKNVAALAKVLSNASIGDVLDSANHPMTEAESWDFHEVKSALYWENSDDFNDFETSKWVPQGITHSADGDASGTFEGRDAWIVSWHNEDDTSARVTFVDRETNMYRHVLLVYPSEEDNFEEVGIHAGGMTWFGNTLWVVDTSIGFRVFDLSNIWKVDIGDSVGKNSDGTYTAANYAFVIPQIRYLPNYQSYPYTRLLLLTILDKQILQGSGGFIPILLHFSRPYRGSHHHSRR